jgi:type II secretion system protein G
MRLAVKGFTLIELLIVVAIIAILAAIAVPNFLEAQTRSKVSRTKSDMRSLATALEAYRADGNRYPIDNIGWQWYLNTNPPPSPVLYSMTTPIAFMSSIPHDIFVDRSWGRQSVPYYHAYASDFSKRFYMVDFYNASAGRQETGKIWALCSYGPDRIASEGLALIYGEEFLNKQFNFNQFYGAIYDPTNGTISNGDIVRLGP